MPLIYGKDEAEERMKAETMKNPVFVSINQKYYADIPSDEEKNAKHHDDDRKKEESHEERAHHAMGGVAKARLDYPHTDKLPADDKRV